MLLKPKIYITILFVYEIIAVMLLHCQSMCTEMLGMTACQDWFRYFAACIIIPGLVSLIWMWLETFVHAYHHRFFRRARSALADVLDKIYEKLANHLTREDLERYITVAALYGVRHYLANNPKFKEILQEMIPEVAEWDLGDTEQSPHQSKTRKKRK